MFSSVFHFFDGHSFFVCEENGVVMTKGVNGVLPPETFVKVTEIETGRVLLTERSPMAIMEEIRERIHDDIASTANQATFSLLI